MHELNLTALSQAKLAAMSPLLPAQEMAGSKSNTRQQGWLLTAVRIFCSSVTFWFSLALCTTDVKAQALPSKKVFPSIPGEFLDFANATNAQNPVKIYQNYSVC